MFRSLSSEEVAVEWVGSFGLEAPRRCMVLKHKMATMGERDKEPSNAVLLKNNDARLAAQSEEAKESYEQTKVGKERGAQRGCWNQSLLERFHRAVGIWAKNGMCVYLDRTKRLGAAERSSVWTYLPACFVFSPEQAQLRSC